MILLKEAATEPTQTTSFPPDRCESCREKFCCVILRVCDEDKEIKPAGTPCPHLQDGLCSIHSRRNEYPGFRDCCATYSCRNIGPLLSESVQDRWINIINERVKLAYLLSMIQRRFLFRPVDYEARYAFLQHKLLTERLSLEAMMQWIGWPEDNHRTRALSHEFTKFNKQ